MAIKPNRLMIEQARKRIQKEELRTTGGSPECASFHSSSYHKAFDGYVEVKRLNASGRSAIQRIYVGSHYEPDEPLFRRVFRRILYALLHAASLVCFFLSATAETTVNYSVPVNLFHAGLFLALLWKTYILFFYIPALGSLTEGDFRSVHTPLVRASITTAILFAGAAVSVLWAGSLSQLMPSTVPSVLLPLILGAAAEIIVGFGEKRLRYHVLSNAAPIPPDASPITANTVSHI